MYLAQFEFLTCVDMKWYVVFRGREPGVYPDWASCHNQVSGYAHSSFKSYNTREDAVKAYMNHVGPATGKFECINAISGKLDPFVHDNSVTARETVLISIIVILLAVICVMFYSM